MAGSNVKSARIAELEAKVAALEGELAAYVRDGRKRRRPGEPMDPNDPAWLEQWHALSEEGLFIDEILARFGWSQEEWEEIERGLDVTRKKALARARVTARAHILKMVREGLLRSSFPTALADRLLAQLEREARGGSEDASGLVHVYIPTDRQSAENTSQVIELPEQ